MINAWELLLKARIIQENKGKVSAIYTYEPVMKKDGKPGKRVKPRLTHFNHPHTISIYECWNRCAGYRKNRVDAACIANLEALLEIRDSATHFVVNNPVLTKKLTEIALAALRTMCSPHNRGSG